MIIFFIIFISVTLIAYAVLGYLDERIAARQRLALATGARERKSASLDKQKIIANIARVSSEKRGGRVSLADLIIKSGLTYRVGQVQGVIGFAGVAAALLAYVAMNSLVLSAVAGLFVVVVIPRIVFGILRKRRENAFLDEFPSALDMISRGLKAGMTISSCLVQISESAKEPVRGEFSYVIDRQKVGMSLSESLRKMPDRIDLMEVRFFAIALEIQQKTGGNLAEIVENISAVIRGRREMRAKIKALVAEAKVSSIIIAIIPLGFAAMGYMSDPESYGKFVTEPIGKILLGICVILYVCGVGIFIKLANPQI